VLPVRTLRPGRRGSVRAHMPGDTGEEIEARAPVYVYVDVMRPPLDCSGNGQCKRSLAKLGRVDAQEQVMHDRIADENAVEDILAVDATFFADLADQAVDCIAYGLGHSLPPIGIHHDVGDAAHHVLAKTDLRVRRAR